MSPSLSSDDVSLDGEGAGARSDRCCSACGTARRHGQLKVRGMITSSAPKPVGGSLIGMIDRRSRRRGRRRRLACTTSVSGGAASDRPILARIVNVPSQHGRTVLPFF